jgi:hypothetical protein
LSITPTTTCCGDPFLNVNPIIPVHCEYLSSSISYRISTHIVNIILIIRRSVKYLHKIISQAFRVGGGGAGADGTLSGGFISSHDIRGFYES